MADDNDTKPGVEVSLAEFNGLRAEILHRVEAQGRLAQLNLAALAAVSGLGLTYKQTSNLLLVMPVFSAGLSFAWLEHMRQLTLIGTYIDRELWPSLSKMTRTPLTSWERTWSKSNPTLGLQIAGSFEPIALLAGPPLFALALSFINIRGTSFMAVWIADIVFVAIVTVLALWFVLSQIRPRWTLRPDDEATNHKGPTAPKGAETEHG